MTTAATKIPLWEMAYVCETEAERVDAWERILKSEGKTIDPAIYRRGITFRRACDALRLMDEHREEIFRLVKARREEARRGGPKSDAQNSESSGTKG